MYINKMLKSYVNTLNMLPKLYYREHNKKTIYDQKINFIFLIQNL